jgi:solute carrier family 1 (neuronal/epithelial high affinity glutamate transporter), member 1
MNRLNIKNSPYLLPFLLMLGAILGFVSGGLISQFGINTSYPATGNFLKLLGDSFMNLLKMLVVPFIFTSMMLGMASISEQKKFGKAFKITFIYYFSTTFLAVIIGITLVSVIQPGLKANIGEFAKTGVIKGESLIWYDALFKTIKSFFPKNIFMAAAKGQMLGIIGFSIVFGYILSTLGKKGKELIHLIDTVNDILMIFVKGVIWLAPVGILGLIASQTIEAGGWNEVLKQLHLLFWYFITVILGLAVHGIIILPLILWIFTKKSPVKHLKHFVEAITTAFTTASSAATLPITLKNAKNANYSVGTSQFVLPLGATINMDGTALYEAVAVIFVAQAYGFHLSMSQIIVIALTSTLAAVGAAAIPHAGLVTMVMVFAAAQIPPEIAAKGIATILAIDWILDRFRTAINVWGDTIGNAIVDKHGYKKEKKNKEI